MKISDEVLNCLQTFQKLRDILASKGDAKAKHTLDISDELGRFNIWSRNIGAHRSGQSSLDYCLRDASHLQSHVLLLLQSLRENLQDASSIASGERLPWEECSHDESESDDGNGALGSQSVDHDFVGVTELDQIVESIHENITLLLRLSISIRNPAPRDSWMKYNLTNTAYEPNYIDHVKSKFPKIEDDLAERLGRANSMRRQYFKYREEHRGALGAGLLPDDSKTVAQSTVASSLRQEAKPTDFDVGEDDELSDSGCTQTSFATSVGAHGNKLTIPLPVGCSFEEPFECPFCFYIIAVSNRQKWKKHIFTDLQPYVCLSKTCVLRNKVFSTRHSWLQHELEDHYTIWLCCFGCSDTFIVKQSLEKHLRSAHADQGLAHLKTLIDLCPKKRALQENRQCSLCKDSFSSHTVCSKHVARHLQDIALFSLPRLAEDEGEDEGGNIEELEEDSLGSEGERELTKIDIELKEMKEEAERRRIRMKVKLEDELKAQFRAEKEGKKYNEKEEIEKLRLKIEKLKLKIEKFQARDRVRGEEERDKKTKYGQEVENEIPKKLSEFSFQENQIQAFMHSKRPDRLLTGIVPNSPLIPNAPLIPPHVPTYVKISKDNIDIETLRYFGLPWEWSKDREYVIILQELSTQDTECLFEYTRKLRRGGTQLLIEDRGRDREGRLESAFVRRRSKSR